MNGKNIALILLAGGLIYGAWLFWVTSNDQSSAEAAYEAAQGSSEFSPEASRGRLAFNESCATCHGQDALGGPGGPPLIHKIYEPGHHGDASFHLAVRNGVQRHHWDFGNMPPQPDITPETVDLIIAYVREAQRAKGIF
jgi:mono/diheme cytochrome c family protein